MVKWEEIPFNENDFAEEKADDFDRQLRQNGGPTRQELEEDARRGNLGEVR